MGKASARARLAEAAFALFDERGYEQTTIDDIAERAGLGRSTFFRHYRSKEDVIFPDHDRLLKLVRDRLQTSGHRPALSAAADAVRLVLLHYIDDGDVARRRYALTSKVPALHDREIVSVASYQRLFREFISARMGGQAISGRMGGQAGADSLQAELRAELRAELMAAAVVAAHNHVLRRWLRAESPDPLAEFDDAMRQVTALFAEPIRGPGADGSGTTIAVFRTGHDMDALLESLRRLIEGAPG